MFFDGLASCCLNLSSPTYPILSVYLCKQQYSWQWCIALFLGHKIDPQEQFKCFVLQCKFTFYKAFLNTSHVRQAKIFWIVPLTNFVDTLIKQEKNLRTFIKMLLILWKLHISHLTSGSSLLVFFNVYKNLCFLDWRKQHNRLLH